MKKGFSLIELMIVIMLIGIVAVIGMPRFLSSPRREAENFISHLNRLVSESVIEAQSRGEPLRIFFSITGKKVDMQTVSGKSLAKPLVIPDSIEISDVGINGKSQFVSGSGEKDSVYFLINQDGISQEVRLVLIDHAVRRNNPRSGRYEFYLNPFTSVFRYQ